jgi:hypothetical protein
MTTVATDGVSIYADKRISGHVGDNTTIRDSGCKILNVQGKLCIGEHKLSFLGFAGALPNRTKITTVVNRFKGGITDFITLVETLGAGGCFSRPSRVLCVTTTPGLAIIVDIDHLGITATNYKLDKDAVLAIGSGASYTTLTYRLLGYKLPMAFNFGVYLDKSSSLDYDVGTIVDGQAKITADSFKPEASVKLVKNTFAKLAKADLNFKRSFTNTVNPSDLY